MQIQPTFYDFAIELAKKDTIIQQQQVRIEELQSELKGLRKKLEQVRAENAIAAERPAQQQTRYWTSEEHKRFLEALAKYGAKDVKSIAAYVGSRNPTQVRTHAQKYFLKLGKQDTTRGDGEESGNSGGEPGMLAPMGMAGEGHKIQRSDSIDNPSADPAGLQAGEVRRTPLASRKRGLDLHVDTDSLSTPKGGGPLSPTSDSDADEDEAMKRRRMTDGFGNGAAFDTEAPRYVAQQISCVGESVICALKGLTPMEYVLFLKGLLENADEHDIVKKCKNIQQTYLQRFTVDDVQHCYLLLVNITKAKSQPPPPPDVPTAAPLGSPTDFPRVQDFTQGLQPPRFPSSQNLFAGQPVAQPPSAAVVVAAAGQPSPVATQPTPAAGQAVPDAQPPADRPVVPKPDPFTNVDLLQAQQEAERTAMAGLSDLASVRQK